MPLDEYARKRSFDQTPEPAPHSAVPTATLRYCVQRHHATRLHYDFRLEVDGALASWAVPQGPSRNPADKRLAVHVEDHPLDYGNFEGNIPKGNYGAGSVMLWDRGTYEPLSDVPPAQQITRGDFKFRLHGEKLTGEFAIVRMKGRGKGNEWLLLKKKDAAADPSWDIEDHAWSVLTGRTQQEIAAALPTRSRAAAAGPMPTGAVPAPLPEWVEPMKAQLAETLPKSGEWLFEIKWDGVRALCFLDEGRLRMLSRNRNPCDRQYPELSVLPHHFPCRNAILDGEIAVLDDAGRPSFSLIQPRIMASDAAAIAQLARSRPATLFLFDLLYLDGHDLRAVPLRARKDLLKHLLKPHPQLRYSEDFTDGAALFAAAREQGLEGIVAKRADSAYESRRSPAWQKHKTEHTDDFVICGYTRDKRQHFGSLALGCWRDGRFVYAGNAGTGFTEKMVADLYGRLQPLVSEDSPFPDDPAMPKETVFVRPELVCSVKYHSWTHDLHLRAPVYLGLRLDMSAVDLAPPPPAPAAARVRFSNLDKVFWPDQGYTKRDLIEYYDSVADYLVPHLKDRPLSLKRYPNGIGGGHFFQKNSPEHFPSWLRFQEIEGKRYVFAEDRPALLYLANLACIDQNPWQSRASSLDHPDWVLIDLDPFECPYDRIVEAAQLVRRYLDQIGLRGYPKTTGGDGLHIYIPVVTRYSYDDTRTFAEILGTLAAGARPDLFTTPRSVAKRAKGKVYFDHLQNGWGKTISAPYVVRPEPLATVATPLDWSEVAPGLTPQQFHMKNAPARFARTGDLFRGVLTQPQELEPALEKLGRLVRGSA